MHNMAKKQDWEVALKISNTPGIDSPVGNTGDIVTFKPIGSGWTEREYAEFLIVIFEKMTLEEMIEYKKPERDDDGKIIKYRKHSIDSYELKRQGINEKDLHDKKKKIKLKIKVKKEKIKVKKEKIKIKKVK